MNDKAKLIKRLNFENWIWVIYIVIGLFSIYGDELIKKSVLYGDRESEQLATNIFSIILVVTLIIYLYFLVRNYSDLERHRNNDAYQIRFLGSLFIFIGILFFLYFQLKTSNDNGMPSRI